MFKIRRLEDRIVLDGAAVLETMEQIQQQEDYAQLIQDFNDQANGFQSQDMIHGDYFGDNSMDLPDLAGPDDDGGGIHVLAISSDVKQAGELEAAAKDDVIVVSYDASSTSLQDLSKMIDDALAGQKAESIAFATHTEITGQLSLVDSDATTADSIDDPAQKNFWKSMGKLLDDGGRIDLLACNLAGSDDGLALISEIEDASGANVAASDDVTGTQTHGGDWMLETGSVDAKSIYFDSDVDVLLAVPLTTPIPSPQTLFGTEPQWLFYGSNYFTDQTPATAMFFTQTGAPVEMDWSTGQMIWDNPTPGTWNIVVTAWDDVTFDRASQAFTLTVNSPPEVVGVLADQAVVQGEMVDYTPNLDAVFNDVDGTPMWYTADTPTWLTMDFGTNRFHGTPTTQADVNASPVTVAVTAWDSVTFKTAGTNFSITITDTNDYPVINAPLIDQTINQRDALNYQFDINTFTDPDGDTLSYTPSGMPSWMAFDSATRTFSGTPDLETDVGQTTVSVRADDGAGGWAQTSFVMTVMDLDSPPYVNQPIPDQSGTQGTPFSFTIDPNTFIDPEGDAVWMTVSGNPSWMSFNFGTANLSGTPADQADVGTFPITVTGWDSNFNSETTTFNVTISDVDDPPEVGPAIGAQSVEQYSGFNFTIPAGSFTDPEGQALTYSVVSGMPAWMSFDGTDTFAGTPTAQGDIGDSTITVQASDPGSQSVSTTFTVTVTDYNDPVVVNQTLTSPQVVAQGSAYNYVIPSATFYDPDMTEIWITTGGTPTWMSYDYGTRTLHGTPTDQTDIGDTTITVTGWDSQSPTFQRVSTTFVLTVTDANTEPPVMTPGGPFEIAEDTVSGVLVGSVTSTDPDTSGETPTYSVEYGNESNYFDLDPVTGEITVTAMGDAAFDFESGVTSWTLGIRAFDTLFQSSTVDYTINLTDVNDEAPEMTTVGPFTFTVMEESASGTNVFQASATDPDTMVQTIDYSIVSGNAAGYFDINAATGQVTVSATGQAGLDFEIGPTTYVLGVSASDGTFDSAATDYTVNLVDFNDNAPIMEPGGPFSVTENPTVNTSVGFASATDDDPGDLLQYWISSGNTDNYFQLNWSTGEISVATAGTALDYEGAQTTYVIGVSVYDGGNMAGPESYTINVTDANDQAPVLQPGGPFSVAENSILGTSVGTVSAIDPDTTGEPTTYGIVGGTGMSNFDINLNTGAITVSATGTAMDFETVSTYTLQIQAGDGVNNSTADYTVNLTDVNDVPPIIQAGTSATIFEDTAAGTPLGIFASATDPDTSNDAITYFFVSGFSEGYFSIDGSSGEISVSPTAPAFDYETLTTEWVLGVRAFDGVDQSSDASFTISLVNVNDEAPVMVPGGPYTVYEDAAASTLIGLASATDADSMGALTYSIVSGDADSYFQISDTGELQVSPAGTVGLDYDTAPTQYVLGVRATDGDNDSGIVNYTVDLVGVDDNAPIMQPTGPWTLAEDATAGDFIGAVTATDVDSPAANITYSIYAGDPNNYFQLNTTSGAITLTAAGQTALDYETKPFYTLAIIAGDGINTPNPPRVYQIDMVDVDDQPPEMQPGGPFDVAENTNAGVTVGVVSATDPDTAQGDLTYAIMSGDPNGYFQISATGQISATAAGATALDYELGTSYHSYELGIYAGDGTQTSAVETYTINLTDLNDESPVMTTDGPFSYTIPEDTAQGVPIFIAEASDPDSAMLTYEITLGNGAGYFDIDPSTGVVSLTAAGDAAMDFDTAPTSYAISVRALDNDANPSSAVSYTINLSDVNDNSPVMMAGTTFTVAEDRTSTAAFDSVSATDADTVLNATFVIDSGNDDNYFAINASSGELSLTPAGVGGIDFDGGPTSYVLGIKAVDGVNPDSAVVNYTIDLVDANDGMPVMQPGGPYSVSEVAANGTIVGMTSATDEDTVGSLTYTILSGDPNSYFTVDNTGQLMLNVAATGTNIDFESATQSYTLEIEATDGTYTSASEVYTVDVVDANDNAPEMVALNPVSLIETAASGANVMTVSANDLDTTGEPISYIVDSGNESNFFALDAETGAVTVTPAGEAGLDFETQTQFTLGIYATDTVFTSTIVNYTINLTDVNENAPALYSAAAFTIYEDAVQGDYVGAATASDPDSTGETITYNLVSGGNGYFDVDSVTGNILVNAAGEAGLEFDPIGTATTQYVLGIQATDGTFQSSVVSYTVNLVDINDTAPVMTPDGPFTLAEDSASGVFANVTATDADTTGEQLTFSILTGNADGYFTIDPTTGELSLAAAGTAAMDYETAPTSYVLGIVADDGAQLSDYEYYTVDLVDVNDEDPVMTPDGPFTVEDEAGPGTPIATLVSTDADTTGETPTYNIVSGTGSNFFDINAFGEVTVNATAGTNLDFDNPNAVTTYTLGIEATDGPNTSATEMYTVNVMDVNDEAPVMQSNGPFTIPEGSAVGVPVGMAEAIDPDTTDEPLEYSITTGNGDGFFEVDTATGQIRVALDGLDFETTSTYVLGIQATDGTNPSSAISYTINLSNVNDEAPVMVADGPFTVFENAGYGYAVSTVSATDPDGMGGNLSFTIISGNDDGFFDINISTGAITTTMAASYSLDFDTAPTSYVLGIQAADGGIVSAAESYTINLLDVNDVAPVMAPGGPFSVLEGSPASTLVGTVSSTDVDTTNDPTSYTIVSGDPLNYFDIDNTGQIQVNSNGSAGLDFDSATQTYVLGIIADDGAQTSDIVYYTVNLTDANDNAPVMTPQTPFTLFEDAVRDTHVGWAEATDVDTVGGPLGYVLQYGDPSGHFALDPNTGEITVSALGEAQLDYDSAPTAYTLGISASDGLHSSAIIEYTINLTDVNDTPPVVTTSAAYSVAETAPRDFFIGQASATDVDTTGEATYYNITSGNADGYFWMDNTTGNIFVSAAGASGLDFESGTTQYVLGITADDGVNTSVEVPYTINLVDMNDEAPVMTPEGPFTVAENASTGFVFADVTSTDADTTVVSPTYSIVTGNIGNYFQIDQTTGELSLTAAGSAAMDYEAGQTSFVIGIRATDGVNDSPIEDYTIELVDANDEAPVLTAAGPFTLAEETPAGNVVATVNATDADTTGETITYAIVSGTGSAFFDIPAFDGVITVDAAAGTNLDYELITVPSYTLGIMAGDGVNTSAIEMYTINIVNLNDEAPVMQSAPAFTLFEDALVGTSIGMATATDADGTADPLTYEIQSGNVNGYFDIDPATGTLSLTAAGEAAVDFESGTTEYVLGVRAFDGEQWGSAIDYTVQLVDVNDTAPVMTQAGPFTIFEDRSVLTAFDSVTSTDQDTTGEVPTYIIQSGNENGYFSINASSGALSLTSIGVANVDFESGTTSYVLSIAASDGVNMSDPLDYTVELVDVNDNAPVMGPDGPFTIFEDAGAGADVATVTASDADTTGETLTFSIVSGDPNSYFSVDPTTGLIEVTAAGGTSLDFESTVQSYTLGIVASDGVNTSVTEYYTIDLLDANDQAPVMESGAAYTLFTIPEDTPTGDVVGTVNATDGDGTGETISYYIATRNDSNHFQLDPISGEISVSAIGGSANGLDFDLGATTYTLGIYATDGSNTSAIIDFTINLSDVNDLPPNVMSSPILTVDESPTTDTLVGQASATDPDTTGDMTYYSIASGNDDGYFWIDPTTGNIFTSAAGEAGLDFESGTTQYVLGIQADDGVNDSSVVSYTVNLINVDDVAPVMTPQAAPFTVNEDYAGGLPPVAIDSVTSTDTDSTGPFSYYIVSGNVGNTFSVTATTGEIHTGVITSPFDYESGNTQYVIGIQATDGTNISVAENYTINILDVNDNAPVMTPGGPFDVDEESMAGTPVAVVGATDVDTTGETLTYAAVSGTGSDYFDVSASGEISVAAGAGTWLDSESGATSYTLEIAAGDGVNYGLADSYTYTINVVDINDTDPVMVTAGPFTIPEGSLQDTSVGMATASDADSVGGPLTYTLETGGDGYFAVDTATGEITVTAAGEAGIDYETATSYVLAISASDGENLSSAVDYTVNIGNINDEAPVMVAQAPFTVAEMESSGAFVIGTASATDPDGLGDIPTYTILTGNDDGFFQIESTSGNITVGPAASIGMDYETGQTTFVLGIRASDGGGNQSDIQNYTIDLVDLNDEAPVLQSGGPFTVFEATAGEQVADLDATDADGTGETLTYSIISGDPASDFSIDPTTGVITTAGTDLDFESATQSYTLGVQASDGVNTSATVSYVVNLVDINDNAPVMTPGGPFDVSEAAIQFTSVGTVGSTDADTVGTGPTYQIASGNTDGFFDINMASGEIFVTMAGQLNLDFETVSTYTLGIFANDGVQDSSTVEYTINLTDADDVPPVLSAAGPFDIPEDLVENSQVGTVTATDNDTPSGSLSYSIVNGDPDGYFYVNNEAGDAVIRLTSLGEAGLDYDTAPTSYVLGLMATDGSQNSATGYYTVNLTDVDDTAPVMQPQAAMTVSEAAAASATFGTVSATDVDSTAPFTYSIASGNVGGYFQVDSATGDLSVASAGTGNLDYDAGQTTYVLGIRATDGINGGSVVDYTINLVDANDIAPVMTADGPFTVAENTSAGIGVANVSATDADTTGEATTYSVVGGTGSDYFAVNAATGEITVTAAGSAALDYELGAANRSFTLDIIGGDGAQNGAALTYTFNVVDSNDQPPVLISGGPYSIDEGVAIGTPVFDVNSTDGDTIGVGPFYWFSSGDTGVFDINSNTGEVQTIAAPAAFDFDAGQTQWVLGITAWDGENNSAEQLYTVNLNDLNDIAPVVGTPTAAFDVPEDVTATTSLGFAAATDADSPAGDISYFIGSGNDLGYFAINPVTGEITLTDAGAAGIDYESGMTTYLLGVQATDGNNASAPVEFTVNIEDANDVAPVMSPAGPFDLSENVAAGESVGFVTATDTDAIGGPTTFAIVSGDPNGYFAVDANTGEITVTGNGGATDPAGLDFEGAQTVYILGIHGGDGDQNGDTGYYTVNLLDANDTAPVVSGVDSVTISEDDPTNSLVADMDATDTDTTGENITFGISSTTPAGSNFYIDSINGEIRTGGTLAPGIYTVNVIAGDGVNASTDYPVTVTVETGVTSNNAPTIADDIDDQTVYEQGGMNPSGQWYFEIPTGTFDDSDIGDSLTLSARIVGDAGTPISDGSLLPGSSWIRFDSHLNAFYGDIPASPDTPVFIEVFATDEFGESVRDEFALTILASLDADLIRALRFIDGADGSLVPEDFDGMEIQDVMMAEAKAPVDNADVNQEMTEVLALLDNPDAVVNATDKTMRDVDNA